MKQLYNEYGHILLLSSLHIRKLFRIHGSLELMATNIDFKEREGM